MLVETYDKFASGLQGMLGETYDRFIAGEAVKAKTSPLYLPDDGQFHGIGNRAQYKMDSYWDTNHVRPLSTFIRLGCRGFWSALRSPPAKDNQVPDAAS